MRRVSESEDSLSHSGTILRRRPLTEARQNSSSAHADEHPWQERARALSAKVASPPGFTTASSIRTPTLGLRGWVSRRLRVYQDAAEASAEEAAAALAAATIGVSTGVDVKMISLQNTSALVVCVEAPPPEIPLFNLIQQIRVGGPLDLARYFYNADGQWLLLLRFRSQDPARMCRAAIAQRRIRLGDYTLELAGDSVTGTWEEYIHTRFHKSMSAIDGGSHKLMPPPLSRRVLNLYMDVSGPLGRRQVFDSNLDVERLRSLLSRLAEPPLAIIPLFEKNQIAVAVHFSSVSAAITVYRHLAERHHTLTEFNRWKCKYGTDPTERLPY